MTQFKDPAHLTFSHLCQSRRKVSHPQDIFFLTSFPKFPSLYLAKPRKYGLLQFWHFHRVVHNNHHHQTVRHRKLEHASKCLIRWSPVHCHYDKSSKGIISAIGSLETINFAKICTFSFRDYSAFRHTSWYHSVRLIVSRLSPSLEVKGLSSLSYLPPKQTLSHQNLCTSSIEDTKHCVQIRGLYLKQKVRYWCLEKCR